MLLQNLPEAANRVGANLRTILAQQLNMQEKKRIIIISSLCGCGWYGMCILAMALLAFSQLRLI